MIKTLTKITLPLLLLFLSGCAHYAHHVGHHRQSSYGYNVDRHNSYRPYSSHYEHEPVIHIYDKHDRHHNSHNYHYDKHNDHNRHRGNHNRNKHNNHNSYNKKSKHKFENHYVGKSSSKSGKNHSNSNAYRPKKHNKYDFHQNTHQKSKYKKRTHKDGKHHTERSLLNSKYGKDKHFKNYGSHKLAKQQTKTWKSKGNRSEHNYYRH